MAQWAELMAKSVMLRQPDLKPNWSYENGVVFNGLERLWRNTGDKRYFDYIKHNIDLCLDEQGNIVCYKNLHNIDHINCGKQLLMLYRETGEEKYKKAADILREQLKTQPRTSEGGFWHKQIYPYQMWLDGLYMGSPFYAEFAKMFGEPEAFDDVTKQFLLVHKHAKDPKTGLLYHAWDESREQKWANKETGCSPNFWGRAMGWYAMAIVDMLDFLPENHNDRAEIMGNFQGMIDAVVKVQDAKTGLWYQVLDMGDRGGNYLEASASCMFIYAIAKAVRMGYLDKEYLKIAEHGFDGVIEHLIDVDEKGLANLNKVCEVAGLGASERRDGSFEYYISEPIKVNDFKGVGAFILSGVELDR